MNPHIKRKLQCIIAPFRRVGLKNRNFSIISNNCWGGIVYDRYGLKYETPTIGCYFFSNEYIEFLRNLKHYLSLNVKPLSIDNSKYKDILLKRHGRDVCLGIIGEKVEIVFLHYKSADDACKKWNYRRKRVNFGNLLIKYNDQNLFEKKHFDVFQSLPYKNKLFFTVNEYLINDKNCVLFPKYLSGSDGSVSNDTKESFRFLNVKSFLNSLIAIGEK